MIKKFLGILFIFAIVLTNKGNERGVKPDCVWWGNCGTGGANIPMFKVCK